MGQGCPFPARRTYLASRLTPSRVGASTELSGWRSVSRLVAAWRAIAAPWRPAGRAAGLPVRLHLDGDRVPLPRAVDLSAYRIVQEGLTNALKHARASHADVTVRYRPDELEIEIRDNGLGSSTTDGLGHGLVGVRERVKIYGGEMSAGTANGGGFVLSTRLPLGVDER